MLVVAKFLEMDCVRIGESYSVCELRMSLVLATMMTRFGCLVEVEVLVVFLGMHPE